MPNTKPHQTLRSAMPPACCPGWAITIAPLLAVYLPLTAAPATSGGSCEENGRTHLAAPLAKASFEYWNRTVQPLVTAAQLQSYADDGVITIRGLLPPEMVTAALEEVEDVWQHYKMPATFTGTSFLRYGMEHRSGGAAPAAPLPFDRLYNLEDRSPALRRLATFRPVGNAVARAMNVSTVRLYMTSYFRKAPGDSASQWHKDEDASPFQTTSAKQFSTLWLPLRPVRPQDGGLMFAKGSHKDACTYFECDLP